MCRIAGLVNRGECGEELKALVKAMCTSLQHGGPDDEGIYLDEASSFCLGHRRLTIIDTSHGGHQPMQYSNGRYVISYNGELYNYKILKRELVTAGWQFNTASDTEVVLAAFACWNTEAFRRLEGMFAFCIYDAALNAIYLIRDSAGIKPLYYGITKEGLSFASEVGSLSLIPYLKEPNNKWQYYFMAYGHLPEPVTTLKFVRPLEKGTFLTYNLNDGSSSTSRYFNYSYIEKIGEKTEAVNLIREALNNSVEQHLISDTPIGVFLSGGLDSGILAVVANKYQQKLNTVSIFFDDKNYSEKKYQDALEKQLSCSHQQFLLREEDFHHFLPGIIDDMDLPCCDGINTWFISKYAKESGLKAVLSGVGGDELYGGYPSFSRMSLALSLAGLPKRVLRTGRFASSKKIKRLTYLSIDGAVGKYLFLRGQFIPSEIAECLNADEQEIWSALEEEPFAPNISYLTPKNQASWIETNLYMQNQLLRDADVMSMAHGLEIRLPFLDKNFIELSLKIKSGLKYSGKYGKQLLIDSYKDQLPKAIWDRPKMGFAFPFKEWLSDEKYSSPNGKMINKFHEKLRNNEVHWSQFFTLHILDAFKDGK